MTAKPTAADTRPVIVFDGMCNLCSRSVAFIIRRDPERRFRFAPMQSEAGARLLQRHGLDPDDVRTLLLVEGGRPYLRSDAWLRVVRRLRGPWRLAAGLRLVPRPVRDWVYGVVARNRYRWFGRREQCLVPTPEERDRFLE